MSTLYIANTGTGPGARGVWRVSSTDYQYHYAAFIPGQDVNLDSISISTNAYDLGQTAPNNFQVGLYGTGVNTNTPGSLISLLSGPSSPEAGTNSSYTATTATPLTAGNQYWLGFTLSSDTGANNNTRVKLSSNAGNYTTLGSGWSVPSMYSIANGNGSNPATQLVFSLSGTSSAVCFCSGTFIRMADDSEKKIEELEIGNHVYTSKGPMPIKWIAKRTIRRSTVPMESYLDALPIRISAGSLRASTPSIDLFVSESHGIGVEGKIVNAAFLVNDVNIVKTQPGDFPSEISYFHLEFDDEVFVLANGTKACSYVNSGNRRSFDNYAEFISLYLNPCNTTRSRISSFPRNRPSLKGHKERVKRSWCPTV